MNSDKPYQEELLQGLNNGDRTAYNKLFDYYFRQLAYFTLSIVADRQLAEDITVESFVTLWNKKPIFETSYQLKSYLFTLVRNAAFNQLKAQKQHQKAKTALQYLSETELPIDYFIIESEILQSIYEAVATLPPQAQQVIRLLFIDGKSVKEIADAMNIATQTVLNQKARGLKILRNKLGNKNTSILLVFATAPCMFKATMPLLQGLIEH